MRAERGRGKKKRLTVGSFDRWIVRPFGGLVIWWFGGGS